MRMLIQESFVPPRSFAGIHNPNAGPSHGAQSCSTMAGVGVLASGGFAAFIGSGGFAAFIGSRGSAMDNAVARQTRHEDCSLNTCDRRENLVTMVLEVAGGSYGHASATVKVRRRIHQQS